MRTHEQHPAAGNRASESSEVAATDFMGELTLLADQFTAAADEFHRNHGLHATDSAALHLLSRSSMTMGELASGLRLTPAAVTSVVDRLESAGLAERRPDDGDRRRTIVSAIPFVDATAEEFHHRVFDALGEVPAEELSRLTAVVGSLRRAIETEGG